MILECTARLGAAPSLVTADESAAQQHIPGAPGLATLGEATSPPIVVAMNDWSVDSSVVAK